MTRIHPFLSFLLTALLLWSFVPAQADDLTGIGDPTRPPARMLARRAGSAAEPEMSASAVDAAVAASAAAEAAARATNLSALRYDEATSEGLALINGQWVKAGDQVKSMTVISITREAVLLSGPKGVRRLRLFAEPEDDVGKPAHTARRGRKEKK